MANPTQGAKPTSDVTEGVSGRPPADFDFLAPPQGPDELGRLGPYRVLKLLGQGGMGAVFQAEDPRLQRTVALKVMLPEYAKKASAKDRFLREARAAAAIEHDHIVGIYQVDEDRGVPYIAMQFLKGMSLDDYIKAQRKKSLGPALKVSQILKVGREIAKGLAAAHERGMIHRDIKPANIWLDGSAGGRVRILDFGLARTDTDQQHLTQSGMILGTPAYMAPEQARAEKVDARADLFSLGVVLYRLCTGELPFKGKDTMSTLMALATVTPPSPIEMNADVPPGLSELILGLLEKDVSKRIGTAQDVVKRIIAIERQLASGGATQAASSFQLVDAPQTEMKPARSQVNTPSVSITAERTENIAPAPSAPKKSAGKTASAKSSPGKSRRRPLWPWLAGGGALAVLALVAAILLLIRSPEGTLLVEVSDPDIEVLVRMGGVVVHDKSTKREFRVKPGDGVVEVFEKNGVGPLTTKQFTLNRGDKQTVSVTAELREARARIRPPGSGAVVSPPVVSPPVVNPPPAGPWLSFAGGAGPGRGKHIVFVAADPEYRSEEMLPQLAAILARHHGFKCTVLFAINPSDGTIDPGFNNNVPGLENLRSADLLVLFARHLDLPDAQMKHFDDYFESGKPVVGLRTATHAFFPKSSNTYARWSQSSSDGGFGGRILGEKWIAHHGNHGVQSTGCLLRDAKHPILRGIEGFDLWSPTDVYAVTSPLPGTCTVLLDGVVLDGMTPTSRAAAGKNNPHVPVAWTNEFITASKKKARVFTCTMGCAQDLEYAGNTRLLVNACYWSLNMEGQIQPNSNVSLVGKYEPTPKFAFGGHRRNVTPAQLQAEYDRAMSSSPASGFTPLFNGKDLAGWRTQDGSTGRWKVEDGLLTCEGPGSFLFSERGDYVDFHLRVEAKINTGGNSGVFFRVAKPLVIGQGYEAQIDCSVDPQRTGSLYRLVPIKETLSPPDTWFTMDIVARGSQIEINVNDAPVVNYQDSMGNRRSGYIALQHSQDRTKVYFRKIEIKELPAAQASANGFTPLFNGMDLTGWATEDGKSVGTWRVEKGAITSTGSMTHLYSQRGDYVNFHLRIDAKCNDKGNGGVYVRCQKRQGTPNGVEAQICHAGPDSQRTGGLWNVARVKESLVKPEEWYVHEIIVEGQNVRVLINGKQTAEYQYRPGEQLHPKGHIALQHHDGNTRIFFRKIEIKELPSGP
jgi:serine/threonine protein kinase/type 1 glutamine amidotransferase